MALSEGDCDFLKEALDVARAAVARGDHPFGAVIVERRDGAASIVVRSMNSVNSLSDSTGHAETNAIRGLGQYLKSRGQEDVASDARYELFTSTEPCMMCCGAIYWCNSITRVVYACPESGLARHAGDDFLCSCRELLGRGRRPIAVDGPFLEAEAEALHEKYWPALFAGLRHAQ